MIQPTAIIVAAGRGVRMGPRGTLSPKGLLEIGGAALISHSVAALENSGISRIRIVTGHLADQYQALFADTGPEIELLYNPAFAATGSLASLLIGLDQVSGPVLILESDVIYEQRGLAPLFQGDCRTVLSGRTDATDEVYVWAKENQNGAATLREMSKNPDARPEPHMGELTGLSSLSATGTERLKAIGSRLCESDAKTEYEPGLVALAKEQDFFCHLIEDLAWAEIDNEDMFAHAQEAIWPRIQASGS